MNEKPKPIAIIVGALAALTLRAITLAVLPARYQGNVPWLPAMLATLLCALIGGYLATRLAQARELVIGALSGLVAGLVMLVVAAVASRLAPSTISADNLVMLMCTGGGALGGWLARVRLSWIVKEYERLR